MLEVIPNLKLFFNWLGHLMFSTLLLYTYKYIKVKEKLTDRSKSTQEATLKTLHELSSFVINF